MPPTEPFAATRRRSSSTRRAGALVAKAREVELQRLRLEAERVRPVGDARDVEVRLRRDRANRGQLVARHLDLGDAGIREGLQPGVVLAAGMAECDELHER